MRRLHISFDELYWAKGKEALDKYRISQLLGLGAEGRREGDPLDFRYRTAAELFRMVEDDQETLIIPYDCAAGEAIAVLKRAGPDRHLLRRLQPFTVPVRQAAMVRLREGLAVEDVDGVAVLTKEELYRRDVGLDLDSLGGPNIEDLIDPVLRAPLPQSRSLGLVREIVPPFEGAPPHQQILISAVSTSSAEDVANFVVIDG